MRSSLNSMLVMDKLEEASSALQQTPPSVEKAKTSLTDGIASIETRQKHIRIADRSEFGWTSVEKYVEDELADGEDDKKRIQRAEFRAGKMCKSTKGAKKIRKGPPLRVKGLRMLVLRLEECLLPVEPCLS